jgi:hypothetical protein
MKELRYGKYCRENYAYTVVGIGSTPTPWRANRGNASVCFTARRTREEREVGIMDVLAGRVGHGDNSNDRRSNVVLEINRYFKDRLDVVLAYF